MSIVLFEQREKVGYITLNRADKRNALSDEMVQALQEIFNENIENNQVKVLVIKAAGKIFCAGADLAYLKKLRENSYDENLEDSQQLKKLFHTIYTYPKVVIAEVQGHAIAGGCGLATICDFVFTTPEAKFGYTEVRIGFIPALVKVFLLRKIGEGRAKELLLLGDLISADKAQAFGMVNFITSLENISTEVAAFAKKLCEKNAATSMQLTKQMIAEVQEMGLEEALDFAAVQNATARGTADCQKGIDAFLNKETIIW